MINIDNIKKYILSTANNTFISKSSNTDKKLASIILSLITNNLVDDLYKNIPKELISLLETNNIENNIDYVKTYLISNGIPSELVNSLTVLDILKIFKNLSLFIKQSSSVSFFQNIINVFDIKSTAIGELYIQHDGNEPYFVPEWIAKSSDIEIDDNLKIPYEEVYNSVPEYIIEASEINQLALQNSILFPLRTNIIYIYTDNKLEINILSSILVSVFVNKYKEKLITYITPHYNNYNVTLYDLILLFYYLIAKKTGAKTVFKIPQIPVSQIDKDNLELISNLLLSYENISTLKSREDLYNELQYFYSTIKHQYFMDTTIDDLKNTLHANYPQLLLEIESNISESGPIVINEYILSIIQTLELDSMYTDDDLYRNHIPIVIQLLFYSYIDNDTLDNIVNTYKPFHALVYNTTNELMTYLIKDPLNTIYMDFYYGFKLNSNYTDQYMITNYHKLITNHIARSSILTLDTYSNDINTVYKNDLNPKDITQNTNISSYTDQYMMTNYNVYTLEYINSSSILISDTINISILPV